LVSDEVKASPGEARFCSLYLKVQKLLCNTAQVEYP